MYVPSERKFNYAGDFHIKARFVMSRFILQDLMYIRMHLPRVDEFADFMTDLAKYCAESMRKLSSIIGEEETSKNDAPQL